MSRLPFRTKLLRISPVSLTITVTYKTPKRESAVMMHIPDSEINYAATASARLRKYREDAHNRLKDFLTREGIVL